MPKIAMLNQEGAKVGEIELSEAEEGLINKLLKFRYLWQTRPFVY